MKTYIKKKWINIFLTGSIIGIYVVMIFLDYKLYALAMDIYNLNVLLSMFLLFSYLLDRKVITKNRLYYCLKVIPILIFIIVCIMIVPRFTYTESQSIVLKNYKKISNSFRINEVNPKRVRVTKSPNLFVKYYYLLSLESIDSVEYYIFNPVTGEFLETEKPWNIE